MTLQLLYWILMLLWLVFGLWANWPAPGRPKRRDSVSPSGRDGLALRSASHPWLGNLWVAGQAMRLALIILTLSLGACSTPDNDVIDQAIAARIYNR